MATRKSAVAVVARTRATRALLERTHVWWESAKLHGRSGGVTLRSQAPPHQATVVLAHYPARYSTPLSEPRYTAAALPPTTVKASATATNAVARYRFMIGRRVALLCGWITRRWCAAGNAIQQAADDATRGARRSDRPDDLYTRSVHTRAPPAATIVAIPKKPAQGVPRVDGAR